jgi:L-fuculose-phosphate aldolase
MLLGDEREQVARTCRRMRAAGLVVGTAGNVSVRRGDLVAISPSGLDYDTMSAGHVGVHALDGTPVEASLQPSSELPLHLAVYAGAITHNHARASTALGLVVEGEVPVSHYYSAMFGGPIRVAPYATFGSDELAAGVAGALRERGGALMSNHGAVTVAPTLAKAFSLLEYLEYVCEIQLLAMGTGRPVKLLNSAQLGQAAELMAGYGQQVCADG